MLRLTLDIFFDKEGNIMAIYRRCNKSRQSCEGCEFQEWCSRADDPIIEAEKKRKAKKKEV